VTEPQSASPSPSASPSASPSPTVEEALPPGNLFDGRVGFAASATKTADSSTDAAGNAVSYDAINVTDGDPETAWRKSTEDWSGDDYILITFDEPVKLTELGLIPGYAKTDPTSGTDRFKQNWRLRWVYWTLSDGTEWEQELEDSPTMQTIPVASEVTWVRLGGLYPGYPEWDETPPARDFLAISDITVNGSVVSD
jgi:hypothetical protein